MCIILATVGFLLLTACTAAGISTDQRAGRIYNIPGSKGLHIQITSLVSNVYAGILYVDLPYGAQDVQIEEKLVSFTDKSGQRRSVSISSGSYGQYEYRWTIQATEDVVDTAGNTIQDTEVTLYVYKITEVITCIGGCDLAVE